MQGEQGGTGNRTIRGDVAVYSRRCALEAAALRGWMCVGLRWEHGGA